MKTCKQCYIRALSIAFKFGYATHYLAISLTPTMQTFLGTSQLHVMDKSSVGADKNNLVIRKKTACVCVCAWVWFVDTSSD